MRGIRRGPLQIGRFLSGHGPVGRFARVNRAASEALAAAPSTAAAGAVTPPSKPGDAFGRAVPEDFGRLGGTPIRNKDSILGEIDLAVARLTDPTAAVGRPPDVEVLFTEHKAYHGSWMSWLGHVTLFRFGHGLVRYTLPDGRQYTMNILGGEGLHLPGGQLVNLMDPAEYIFGTRDFRTWNQQGGVYNGSMVGVRIEKAPAGATEALHAYFQALDKRSRVGDRVAGPGSRGAIAQFQIAGGRTMAWIREHFPRVKFLGVDVRQTVLSGNCAQWTSTGMKWAGLVHRSRMFPKAIFVDILEDQWFRGKEGPSNVHVVYYKQALRDDDPNKFYKDYYNISSFVNPLYLMRNVVYWNLERFADVTVSVPEGTCTAIPTPQPKPARPPKLLKYSQGIFVTSTTAAFLVFGAPDWMLEYIGGDGSPGTRRLVAAGWVLINWIVY